MSIQASNKIEISLLPEILSMTMLCQEEEGYIPLSFFYNLGASRLDLENTLSVEEKFFEKNNLKVCYEETIYDVISYRLAAQLIAQLATISPDSIFKIINNQLLKLSLESQAISVDEFAEDFKNDQNFWSLKLSSLTTWLQDEVQVPRHPGIECRQDDDEEYFNPEGLSFILVHQIANPFLTKDNAQNVKSKLQEMLHFYDQDSQYNYFLYHILIGDGNICLLSQSLFADWITETQF